MLDQVILILISLHKRQPLQTKYQKQSYLVIERVIRFSQRFVGTKRVCGFDSIKAQTKASTH